MTISGYTFARNSQSLHFPIKESIASILPLVDEFIVALGNCDEEDRTLEEILSLQSSKIKIVHTSWDEVSFNGNTVYAQQSDLAKSLCRGDWLFYLQNDEVVHEQDHQTIIDLCQKYHANDQIEGFLFQYLHFWGDYDHYHQAHNWYPKEIRIIRNRPGVHSWRDAQSFRVIDPFEGSPNDYIKKRGTRKLNVIQSAARIFHYGWVRNPRVMTKKARIGNPTLAQKDYRGKRKEIPDLFDYGPLDRLKVFTGSHPEVMKMKIEAMDWVEQLQYNGKRRRDRPLYKHERLKYRLLSWIENNILGGRQIGGFKNYRLIKASR